MFDIRLFLCLILSTKYQTYSYRVWHQPALHNVTKTSKVPSSGTWFCTLMCWSAEFFYSLELTGSVLSCNKENQNSPLVVDGMAVLSGIMWWFSTNVKLKYLLFIQKDTHLNTYSKHPIALIDGHTSCILFCEEAGFNNHCTTPAHTPLDTPSIESTAPPSSFPPFLFFLLYFASVPNDAKYK